MTTPVFRYSRGRDLRGDGLYAQVVDTLGQDIVNGVLKPGEIVYAEQLCANLGVSRSVVREGLRTLGSMGLIEARPRVGTRVLPRSRWDLLNPMIVYWRGRGNDYLNQQRELLELRIGIEGSAARLAATRMSNDAASDLLTHAVAMLAAFDALDRPAFYDADSRFHRTLLEGSGNLLLAQFADTVEAMLQAKSVDHRPGMASLQAVSARRHLQLAQALVQRDPKKAEQVAREIVEGTLAEFEAGIKAAAQPEPEPQSAAAAHS